MNLRDHYLNFHKLDPLNAFFKKLFNECANRVLNKNFALCGDFLTTLNYKKAHDFVKHYKEGKEALVDDKPLDIVKTLSIIKYQISYSKLSDYNNFSNSEQVINECLTNVKLHFKPEGSVQIKAVLLLKTISRLFLNIIHHVIILGIRVRTFILQIFLIHLFIII